ncbi:hypothetical protein D9M68_908630 [compost metagenome]
MRIHSYIAIITGKYSVEECTVIISELIGKTHTVGQCKIMLVFKACINVEYIHAHQRTVDVKLLPVTFSNNISDIVIFVIIQQFVEDV